jgi:hypothetical protein
MNGRDRDTSLGTLKLGCNAEFPLINMLLAFEVLNDYIITEVHAINSMNKYTYHVQIQLCSKARLRTKLTQC